MSDDELRQMWRDAGGKFHGPITETGTMPESLLLPFLRSMVDAAHAEPHAYHDGWADAVKAGVGPSMARAEPVCVIRRDAEGYAQFKLTSPEMAARFDVLPDGTHLYAHPPTAPAAEPCAWRWVDTTERDALSAWIDGAPTPQDTKPSGWTIELAYLHPKVSS